MINLIEIASGGRFQTGQLTDEDNMRDTQNLAWNDRTLLENGFVGLMTNAVMENGARNNVLHMHPKWVENGTIKAWLPWQLLPESPILSGWIGFLDGALGTDGVSFQIWEHHNSRGREVWNRVFHYDKEYDNNLVPIEVDLSHLSNQRVGIELRIDAGSSSGKDWAAWVNPVIRTSTRRRANVWTLNPTSLTVNNRNEERRIEGKGDEPYLGGLYFRSVFGKAGTTKVVKLDKLHTLGNNIGAGESVAIPEVAELKVSDVGVTWANELEAFFGVQVMGYILVAMERDKRGKSAVKCTIDDLGDKLFNALKEHVEMNPEGLGEPEETIDSIEDDVYGRGGGVAGGGASIIKPFKDALKWLLRGDDIIGQNQLIIIGFSEDVLSRHLDGEFDPDSRENPIAPLSNRNFNLDFSGSDAHYSVQIRLEQSDEDILAR